MFFSIVKMILLCFRFKDNCKFASTYLHLNSERIAILMQKRRLRRMGESPYFGKVKQLYISAHKLAKLAYLYFPIIRNDILKKKKGKKI